MGDSATEFAVAAGIRRPTVPATPPPAGGPPGWLRPGDRAWRGSKLSKPCRLRSFSATDSLLAHQKDQANVSSLMLVGKHVFGQRVTVAMI